MKFKSITSDKENISQHRLAVNYFVTGSGTWKECVVAAKGVRQAATKFKKRLHIYLKGNK